jgi:lipopolysaccharide transport system ATP-binding protein
MTEYAIRVEGLCKEYIIGGREEGNRTFRETISDALSAPLRHLRAIGQEPLPEERFWALQNVSFDVKRGEVVGIIGRNGAGKSTLLKILSRITAPSKGKVEIRGQVASLLEVGTGFHPELTGRENIYLNGTILGMSRAEVRHKFGEIVGFAGVYEFLDTPVKRYSSGMLVRLAFAVAAHLEPDILLIDEVLAVGDAEFQRKSLGRMQDTARSGRTVFFVSHNMNAIQALCDKCILLDDGHLLRHDATGKVVADYLRSDQCDDVYQRQPIAGRKKPTIVRATILRPGTSYDRDAPALCLDLDVWTAKNTATAIDVRLKDHLGTPVAYGTIGSLTRDRPIDLVEGINKVRLSVLLHGLALGRYLISLDLNDPNIEYYDRLEDCLGFEIDASMLNGASLLQMWGYGSSLITVEKIEKELYAQI